MTKQGFFQLELSEAPEQKIKTPGKKYCGIHCHLEKTCTSPHMKYSGKGKKKVLIIAEAPGRNEDEQGTQLIGKAGNELRRNLQELGFSLDRDCWKTNALKCRPPKNRTPKPAEIAACRQFLLKEIEQLKPRVIILLGGIALEAMYGHRWKKGLEGISRWRGFVIADQEARAWVVPTYHPSYVLRQVEKYPAFRTIFRQDLERAFKKRLKKFPIYHISTDHVKILLSADDITEYLGSLVSRCPEETAFDYETTGLKPHREGHRIVSCAITEDGKTAYAFPVLENIKPALKEYLRKKEIKKIAANIPFEQSWSRIRLGTTVRGWSWDTVMAAHVLDNRPHIAGVKFQAAVRFGIMDYASKISRFLVGVDEKDANSLNRIDKVPLNDLLKYNGMDALIEFRLAKKQQKELA